MKVIINSLGDKKAKYKIYDLNGKKRKLLSKGKFLHKAETDIAPQNDEIIVRVTRNVSFFSAFYVLFMQIFSLLADTKKGIYSGPELNWFWEIRINNLHDTEVLNVTFNNPKSETRNSWESNGSKLGDTDVLYCTDHSFKRDTSLKNKLIFLEVLFVFLLAGIIVALVFLIYLLCIHFI